MLQEAQENAGRKKIELNHRYRKSACFRERIWSGLDRAEGLQTNPGFGSRRGQDSPALGSKPNSNL